MITGWEKVEQYLANARYQTWDGCHKIYLVMDNVAANIMQNYDYIMEQPDLNLLHEWFDSSCGLRFIEAVKGNMEFTTLIKQFDPDVEMQKTIDKIKKGEQYG